MMNEKDQFKSDRNCNVNEKFQLYLPNIRKCIRVGGLNEPQTNKIIFFRFLLLSILWFFNFLFELNEVENI